jgi:hypothetical protein
MEENEESTGRQRKEEEQEERKKRTRAREGEGGEPQSQTAPTPDPKGIQTQVEDVTALGGLCDTPERCGCYKAQQARDRETCLDSSQEIGFV